MIKLKNIIIGTGIILFDIAVYFVLGTLLMNYDDFYDESKGEYWSLASMTLSEKANYIGLHIWNLINLIVIGYIIYRIIKKLIRSTNYNNAP